MDAVVAAAHPPALPGRALTEKTEDEENEPHILGREKLPPNWSVRVGNNHFRSKRWRVCLENRCAQCRWMKGRLLTGDGPWEMRMRGNPSPLCTRHRLPANVPVFPLSA
eukprot:RCo007668